MMEYREHQAMKMNHEKKENRDDRVVVTSELRIIYYGGSDGGFRDSMVQVWIQFHKASLVCKDMVYY